LTKSLTALELTRELVHFDTINPPGKERECALFLARILEEAGFSVSEQEFAPGRSNLIARLSNSGQKSPLCFAGHLDTVPLGAAQWRWDAFSGEIHEGRMYGRGASDMKSGVAAIVSAALEIARRSHTGAGLTLVFTAGEETGCLGARKLGNLKEILGDVGALIVAEPTSNYPVVGHKGALWLEAITRGVTAHGSMPERGVNAIYKAARVVSKLENFEFSCQSHPILGKPTLNVGTISGGLNVNSVPDEARIGIDIRTIPPQNHEDLFKVLSQYMGDEAELFKTSDAGPVWTDPEDPWIREVYEIMTSILQERPEPRGVTYFTDASVLTSILGNPPTLILGPGEAAMAHQTDEYCEIYRIDQAVEAYQKIADKW
jgi:succinyl-diaminopimelate desuccinylase